MDMEAEHQNVPLDIVQEILLNLSVKTLIRFQCVSKQWCSLISHPSFQQDHFRRRSQKDPLFLLTVTKYDKVRHTTTLHLSTYNNYGGNLVDKFSVSVPHRYKHTLRIKPCRGLVCISDFWEKQILLCNISTREMVYLPPPDELSDNIGFGYASSTKEFKVVRFFSREDPNGRKTYFCEVFTLGSSGWREARCSPPQYENACWVGAPFLNGALHLLPDPEDSNADISIYAFDIESEEYTKIHLPVSYTSLRANPDFVIMELTELGGKLCATCDFHTTLEIWLLKDYGSEEWVKEYTIDVTSVGCWGEPLTTMGDGSILISIGTESHEVLYCYNPHDKSFTHKPTEKGPTTLYVESFFSPKVLSNPESTC